MAQDNKEPLSTRVPLDTKLKLERAAKKHNISLASFVACILEDYIVWLEKEAPQDLRPK